MHDSALYICQKLIPPAKPVACIDPIRTNDSRVLRRMNNHDFRHSHASLLANEGINIQEIARRLGHSKIEITWNTYSHLYPKEEDRAVSILNRIKYKMQKVK